MREKFSKRNFELIKKEVKKRQPLNPYIELSILEDYLIRKSSEELNNSSFKLEIQNGNIAIFTVNEKQSQKDYSFYSNKLLDMGLTELAIYKSEDNFIIIMHDRDHSAITKLSSLIPAGNISGVQAGRTIKSTLELLEKIKLKFSNSVY